MFGSGDGLPSAVEADMGARFGSDLSTVRLHENPTALATARLLGADAFTLGEDIGFAPGKFDPSTGDGRELLAHELTHVLQQRRAGRAIMGQESAATIREPAVGDVVHVLGPYEADGVRFDGGEQVEVLSARTGLHIEVTLLPPYAKAGQPVTMPLAMLSHVGEEGEHLTTFQVQVVTEDDFAAIFGIPAQWLPVGAAVAADQLPTSDPFWGTGTGMGWAAAPMPAHPVPPGSTGFQWTQTGAGHLSVFAQPGTSATMRGFRGSIVTHANPWATLNQGVPGAVHNDWMFRWMPNQTVVYRPVDAPAAIEFGQRLEGLEHRETYRFPPRAGAPDPAICRNCITVMRGQVVQALGGEPILIDPVQGPIDVTAMGRPAQGQPFEPGQAGRGTATREYLAQPDAYFEQRGLVRTTVPNTTIAARGGVVVIRGGGYVLLLYGATKSYERLSEAHGTPYFGLVASQETGLWVGGLIGSALGSAAAAGLACAPTGPGALACAAAGFAGGLIFGTLGGIAGARIGEYVYRTATEGPRAGSLAFPTVYTFFLDAVIDLESLDPEGAAVVRKAYSGDPQAVEQFMHGITGVPSFGF
jgi:hypothetical protein